MIRGRRRNPLFESDDRGDDGLSVGELVSFGVDVMFLGEGMIMGYRGMVRMERGVKCTEEVFV